MLFLHYPPHFSVIKKKKKNLLRNEWAKLLSKYFNYLILLLYN